MGRTMTISSLPIFRTLVFFVLCFSIEFPTFFSCVSYAALLSSDKSTEEIAREYGNAVIFITAFDKDGKTLGEGSGFIVDPEGIIVTNYHCIEGAETAKVRLTNGAYYDVEGVLGVDNDWDIAVLKVKAKNLPTAPLGDSDKVSVGERVVVIGNPLGLENTVSEGIISALRGREESGDVLIQFTAPISPGSSGGPVFNKKGDAIGVTTLYLKEGQNLNFAVPINRAKPLLNNRKPIALAEAPQPVQQAPPVTTLSPKEQEIQEEILNSLGLKKDPDDTVRHMTEQEYLDTLSPAERIEYDNWLMHLTPAERMEYDNRRMWRDTFIEAQRHFDLGRSFVNEGQYDSAISEFQEAIKLKPDNAFAYIYLGFAYDQKGLLDLAIRQYELAIRQSEEAIRLKPDFAEAYYPGLATAYCSLGEAYYEKGLYDLAIRQYEEAIRLKPDYADAYYSLGLAYANKGLYDLAIRQYEEAIRLKPDYADAYLNLGVVYDKKGLYDPAIRQYEEAIRLKLDYADAYLNLGSAYGKKGLYDLAIRQYEEAIRLKPDFADAYYSLGVVYARKGLLDLAVRHLEQALLIKPDFKKAHELLEELYRQRGR